MPCSGGRVGAECGGGAIYSTGAEGCLGGAGRPLSIGRATERHNASRTSTPASRVSVRTVIDVRVARTIVAPGNRRAWSRNAITRVARRCSSRSRAEPRRIAELVQSASTPGLVSTCAQRITRSSTSAPESPSSGPACAMIVAIAKTIPKSTTPIPGGPRCARRAFIPTRQTRPPVGGEWRRAKKNTPHSVGRSALLRSEIAAYNAAITASVICVVVAAPCFNTSGPPFSFIMSYICGVPASITFAIALRMRVDLSVSPI